MRRTLLITACGVLAALVAPGTATAQTNVSCSGTTNVHFAPGLTFDVNQGSVSGDGSGTCSGTIDGDAVAGPVSYRFNGSREGSCAVDDASVRSVVRFEMASGRRYQVLVFDVTAHRVGFGTQFSGTSGGSGQITVTGTHTGGPPAPPQNCTEQNPITDVTLQTQFAVSGP